MKPALEQELLRLSIPPITALTEIIFQAQHSSKMCSICFVTENNRSNILNSTEILAISMPTTVKRKTYI